MLTAPGWRCQKDFAASPSSRARGAGGQHEFAENADFRAEYPSTSLRARTEARSEDMDRTALGLAMASDRAKVRARS